MKIQKAIETLASLKKHTKSMNETNQFLEINKILKDYKIDFEVKTKNDLIELLRRLGARDPSEADIAVNFEDVVRIIPSEDLISFSEEFLARGGIVFDREKGVFIDTEQEREYESWQDAWWIVSEEFLIEDFEEFLKRERQDDLEKYIQNLRNKIFDEIVQTNDAIELVAKEAEKIFGLNYDQMLNNLKNNGSIGAGIRNYVLGISDDILDFVDPETGEWLVKKALSVSHRRHALTDYDKIDKSGMDEFEVDELRREKNREALREE